MPWMSKPILKSGIDKAINALNTGKKLGKEQEKSVQEAQSILLELKKG